MRFLCTAAACLLLPPCYLAGLEFESTALSKSAQPDDLEVPFTFKFVNSSSDEIQIHEVDTSCSCTSATSSQPVYLAGENGTVDIIYSPGNSVGDIQESATVLYSLVGSDDRRSIELTLNVHVPEIVVVEKRMLHWGLSESNWRWRSVTVSIADGHDAKFMGIEAAGAPSFNFETLSNDNLHVICVQPTEEVRHKEPQEDNFHAYETAFILTDHPVRRYSRIPLKMLITNN